MLKINMILYLFLFVPISTYYYSIEASETIPTGIIKGKVLDRETKAPLVGVNIILTNTHWGSATDMDGQFSIDRLPVGNYSIKFNYIGYHPVTKTDVIVRPNRITHCNAELKISAIKTQEIVVTEGYFSHYDENPTSVTNFASEEIRRAPGSAGDVSRIIYGLPSVAKVNDSKNSLIVRGGAAFENGFYLDNIEIPNINHYPEYGSSGGPIGMLNVDFIRDVNFYTGGFSSVYGDKLSSIMELSFREGNRDEFDAQLDLHFAGFGGVAEGPLAQGKGSWLLSARKSFLDLIVHAIGEDENSIPNYGDIQGKLVFDISIKHKLIFLNILGIDEISSDRDNAVENDENMYMNYNLTRNTSGINWRWLWGPKGYSNTSLSHTITKINYVSFDSRTYRDSLFEKRVFEFKPVEHELKLRNINYYSINPLNKLQFGFEVKHIMNFQDHYYGEYNDDLGHKTVPFNLNGRLTSSKLHGFINYNWQPFTKLNLNPGIRIGHFIYNENTYLSPRFSFSYRLDLLTTINGAVGIFNQNLPLSLLLQNPLNKGLKDPTAYHWVLGINRLLSENTRLTVEVYDKEYHHLPLDPMQPTFCILDQVVRFGIFYNPNQLVDSGNAYSRGIEIMLQNKLAKKLYGIISGSYFRSKYQDYEGLWRTRVYDNRFIFNVEGGYKPNNKWEFSLRWIYAGGRPYTPFNIAASEQLSRGVYDDTQTNMLRLPDYHSLNIRFDRRFHFSGSNLIFYFSIWNVYGRKNLSSYDWNEMTNEEEESRQWGMLPIFGLEFEL